MRKLILSAIVIVFALSANAQISINGSSWLYSQNFNTLQTQSNVGYPMNIGNWQIFEFVNGSFFNNQYRGGNGSDPSGEIYSFGQVGSSDRALGSVATAGLEAHYGVSFINNSGSAMTSFNVGFRQEQWRVGDAGTLPDTVRCYYSTNATSIGDLAATWTEVSALIMTSLVSDSTTSGSILNGNLQGVNKYAVIGVTVPVGGIIRIRFVDRNNPGEDDGIAIDNFFANIGNCSPMASFAVDSAGCYGDNNGSILVDAFGGQSPYEYSFNGGPFQSANFFQNLTGGVYYINIRSTINTNCTSNTNIQVPQRDSMAVSFGVTDASCMHNDGSAWASVTSNVTPYTYLWNSNPVQTTSIATNLPNGPVTVSITDGSGCTRTQALTVPFIPLFNGEEICSITVDSTTDKNLLVWNKIAPAGSLDKYYIYRADSNANNYALLDSVDYTVFSTYLDNSSSPSTNYYSYYITAKSGCGESTPSVAHTEKRLIGILAGGNYILNWNDYIGLTGIDSQYVYQSFNGGPFTLFSTVPVTQPGDAHFNPPAGNYRYFVALPKTGGCNPVLKSTAYEYIMSNIVEVDVPLVVNSVNSVSESNPIAIYPNPSSGVFNLSISEAIGKKMQMEVMDMLGKVVNSAVFINTGTQTINLMNVPAGTYSVRLVAEDKAWVSKITIQ